MDSVDHRRIVEVVLLRDGERRCTMDLMVVQDVYPLTRDEVLHCFMFRALFEPMAGTGRVLDL